MINVLMICSNGISSSLVVSRMQKYAYENHYEMHIQADNEDNLPYVYKGYDIILVAPQLAHHYQIIQSTYIGTGIITALMNQRDYGMADGKALVESVIRMYDEKNPGGNYAFEEEMLQMITHAGKAKQLAYETMDMIEKKQYAKARQLLKSGRKELLSAHQIQSTVISTMMNPASRAKTSVSILMVHAQDQVSAAENTIEMIDHMIRIFERR